LNFRLFSFRIHKGTGKVKLETAGSLKSSRRDPATSFPSSFSALQSDAAFPEFKKTASIEIHSEQDQSAGDEQCATRQLKKRRKR
jgi:hypothetical protein